ncbi:hypothetical protein ACFLJ0_004845 [Vibrio alginolyticus]
MRLVNVILDSINRSRKQAATDCPSEHIANGGLVQRSEKTFADVATNLTVIACSGIVNLTN